MKKALFATVAAFALATSAQAATIFVGSWDVYNDAAESWDSVPPNGPLAYTGQEAAALLFGGIASDYTISTISDQVSAINNSAWYDVIGFGGEIFAQDYSNKYLGQFYGPTSGFGSDNTGAASAFIRDNLEGAGAINFAFRNSTGTVPEPASWALLIIGFGLTGAAMRRRNSAARVTFS